jgi:hypothetical protein
MCARWNTHVLRERYVYSRLGFHVKREFDSRYRVLSRVVLPPSQIAVKVFAQRFGHCAVCLLSELGNFLFPF